MHVQSQIVLKSFKYESATGEANQAGIVKKLETMILIISAFDIFNQGNLNEIHQVKQFKILGPYENDVSKFQQTRIIMGAQDCFRARNYKVADNLVDTLLIHEEEEVRGKGLQFTAALLVYEVCRIFIFEVTTIKVKDERIKSGIGSIFFGDVVQYISETTHAINYTAGCMANQNVFKPEESEEIKKEDSLEIVEKKSTKSKKSGLFTVSTSRVSKHCNYGNCDWKESDGGRWVRHLKGVHKQNETPDESKYSKCVGECVFIVQKYLLQEKEVRLYYLQESSRLQCLCQQEGTKEKYDKRERERDESPLIINDDAEDLGMIQDQGLSQSALQHLQTKQMGVQSDLDVIMQQLSEEQIGGYGKKGSAIKGSAPSKRVKNDISSSVIHGITTTMASTTSSQTNALSLSNIQMDDQSSIAAITLVSQTKQDEDEQIKHLTAILSSNEDVSITVFKIAHICHLFSLRCAAKYIAKLHCKPLTNGIILLETHCCVSALSNSDITLVEVIMIKFGVYVSSVYYNDASQWIQKSRKYTTQQQIKLMQHYQSNGSFTNQSVMTLSIVIQQAEPSSFIPFVQQSMINMRGQMITIMNNIISKPRQQTITQQQFREVILCLTDDSVASIVDKVINLKVTPLVKWKQLIESTPNVSNVTDAESIQTAMDSSILVQNNGSIIMIYLMSSADTKVHDEFISKHLMKRDQQKFADILYYVYDADTKVQYHVGIEFEPETSAIVLIDEAETFRLDNPEKFKTFTSANACIGLTENPAMTKMESIVQEQLNFKQNSYFLDEGTIDTYEKISMDSEMDVPDNKTKISYIADIAKLNPVLVFGNEVLLVALNEAKINVVSIDNEIAYKLLRQLDTLGEDMIYTTNDQNLYPSHLQLLRVCKAEKMLCKALTEQEDSEMNARQEGLVIHLSQILLKNGRCLYSTINYHNKDINSNRCLNLFKNYYPTHRASLFQIYITQKDSWWSNITKQMERFYGQNIEGPEEESERISNHGFWIGNESIKNEHAYDSELSQAIVDFLKGKGAQSVVDFGCGPGKYTEALLKNGLNCVGYDGNPETPAITNGLCKVIDLAEDFQLETQFEWVLCLEVGEHIPKEFESVLLRNLKNHCQKGIILSWAVIDQPGFGHCNCQNNDYVKKTMADLGFIADQESETILREKSSLPWFKNTILVFTNAV
ncbi:UNKNOWN [Stylonychia lemnae]|uniref:Uncharacterized protein n=1 Tax=Stylonychia lemnae TaxID=5949 RepID=A0A078AA04_STYLE|nr:UNKNOWN [Stylonychia lemnae]|eukprot:CDW77648.1 UNKNOWN [Stylonychia lemnae]